MKKIILLTITCLLAVTAWGQSSFYKKYAGYKEVSKVYISSSLFSLMGDNSELEISSQINVAGIIQNLDGLYILSTSNQKVIAEMRKDFEKQIKSGEFEVLMEIEDGDDKVIMYMQKQGTLITDLYICADDYDDFAIIYLSGKITPDNIKTLIKAN
ncbi:MAG: DUF4252 domain-containing protein [Bacteroidales bacterium]|jgi:hypothetical protein|nr:DUF4252 domain-containing protein [Bacteroidales bacterium]NLK79538.1 DUF4252 domain-containing protein [Bacteroidales bacterium]